MPKPSPRILPAFLAGLAGFLPPLDAREGGVVGPEPALRPSGAPVHVGHQVFRIGEGPELADELVKPLWREGVLEPGYFVVHFRGPVTSDEGVWLDETTGPVRRTDGSEVARAYLPDDALLAWVDGARTLGLLASDERTDWIGRYQPGFKLDPGLTEAVLEGSDGKARLWNVDLVPGHAPERLARDLERRGAKVREHVHHRGRGPYDLDFLIVEAPAAAWGTLARIEGIRVVGERGIDASASMSAGDALARDLDSRLVAALATRAEAGSLVTPRLGQRISGTPYDEAAALVDLLAFDDPRLRVWTPSEDFAASILEPAIKNALTLRSGESAAPFDEEASAALVRARRLQAASASERRAGPRGRLGRVPDAVLGERALFERDVPVARGFHGPLDRPHVLKLSCDGSTALDITLAWTDEPGSPGSYGRRINDLDLVVVAPDGRAYRGNRFDETGASRPGGQPDTALTAEHVTLPEPQAGAWTVTVLPVRGAFAQPQGYALVASGGRLVDGQGSDQKLVVPITAVLHVIAAEHSGRGPLSAQDVQKMFSSDDDRYLLRKREQVTLAFESVLPPGAIVSAIRVQIEHHELRRVNDGDILWKAGQGSVTAPTLVGSTAPPLRDGPSAEGVDVWSPSSIPDPNALVVVIDNPNQNDGTNLDRVWVEADYTVADLKPTIVSVPNPTAIVGEAYAYDANNRPEADGPGPITWSVVSAPAGFTIHPSSGVVTWAPQSTGTFSITLQAANSSGSGQQAFQVGVETAPFPATLFPAAPSNRTYLPPERLAFAGPKSQQRINVFLPPGPVPAGGWPVVVNNRAGGGIPASVLAQLNDTGATAPLHAFVASGVAVVDFGVTGIGSGQGLFYPPGHSTGRYESFQPNDDNPEKEAEWAVQWVKTQELFPLDPHRICLRGSSQGAILAIWDSMGPSRVRTDGSTHVRASTRVKAILALQPPTSVWAFDQSTAINTRMTQHYERADQPGVPALAFGLATEELQKTSSVMGFAFDSPVARVHNRTQPVCLLYAEPVTMTVGVPADLTLDAEGYPNLHDTLAQPYIHDSWSGYVLWRRLIGLAPSAADFHAEHSIFAMRNTTALAPPFDDHTQTFTGNVFGAQATAIGHAWVLRELGATQPTSPKIQPGR